MRQLIAVSTLASSLALAAAPARADDQVEQKTKEQVLKEQASELDEKLKALFDVPETPAAEALGVTGDAISHPETVKDVALQVLAAVSDNADISQGVALELAPFRTAVYKGTLSDFSHMSYAQHLAGSLAFSLAAISQPGGVDAGVRYSFGFRAPFLDDRDYRRNDAYRSGVESNLTSCARKLMGTANASKEPMDTNTAALIRDDLQQIQKDIDAWVASAVNVETAKHLLAAEEKKLDALAVASTESAPEMLLKIEQAKLGIATAQRHLDRLQTDFDASGDTLKRRINNAGQNIDNFDEDRLDKNRKAALTKQKVALDEKVRAIAPSTATPAERDTNRAAGALSKEAALQARTIELCKSETDALGTLNDSLTGNRLELSTATIVSNPSAGRASWEQTLVALAYERRGLIGYGGVAGRAKFFDPDSLKAQLDAGARAGFDTGRFSGALSAAAGASDLSSPTFVFTGGANTSVVVADTFMARLGMLTTYQHGPGLGLTAYLAIATANGEDFFTHVIASK